MADLCGPGHGCALNFMPFFAPLKPPDPDEVKRREVRAFLASLSPSEVHRMIELFRMQLGLPPAEYREPVTLTSGLERQLPGNAMAVRVGKS